MNLPGAVGSLSELGRYRLFAHHPDCARHDHHLVRPFGYPLCLGCFGLYTGLVATGVALWFARADVSGLGAPGWSALPLFGLALLAFAPTFGQPFVQKRWYKLPARLLLGAGFAFAIASVIVAPLTLAGWAFRLVAAAVTYALYRSATRLRARRTPDPCNGCPWGAFPMCAHNVVRLRALRDASTDPGQTAFLAAMVADLEPLAAVPPSMNGPRPTPRPAAVAFETVDLDAIVAPPGRPTP